jgi:transcriptional regulator with XRE-family HTH domain
MPTRALHAPRYRPVPPLLRALRTEAGLTTRALAAKLGKPQSWVYKCENAERRVDVAEFCLWCKGCSVDPAAALKRLGALLR